MKFIDCFTFYNEFDVLEIRLKELYDKVDHFVLVDANRTHSNKPKDFLFNKEDSRWQPYLDKIVAVRLDATPNEDRWAIENQQRNAIISGLVSLPLEWNDFVMVSDVDEIPDMGTWNGEEGSFTQRHSYYSFDWVDPRPWNGTVGVYWARFLSPYGRMVPQDLRNFRDLLKPCGMGWHFGWLGNEANAKNKVQNFAHSELDNSEFLNSELPNRLQTHKHPDGTQLIYTTEYLPKACNDYPQYFAGKYND